MTNTQDPMTQKNRNTQQITQKRESKMIPKTKQDWKSEMKPKTTVNMRMRMRTTRIRLDTVNQQMKT